MRLRTPTTRGKTVNMFPGFNLAALAALALLAGAAAKAGDLEPLGAPAPTPGPEPRIAVNSLPGSVSAEHIIAESGSYYLNAGILGSADTSGILIRASNVSLDLNGFTVRGAASSKPGIATDAANLQNLDVHGGIVRDWGMGGLNIIADNSLLHSIRVSDNISFGLRLFGEGGVIHSCSAMNNASVGFVSGNGVLIRDCVASGNTTGFDVQFGGSALNCIARGNNTRGFTMQSNSRVEGCVAASNGDAGIRTSDSCAVIDNSCLNNGLLGGANAYGILVNSSGHSLVQGNYVTGGGRGIAGAGPNVFIQNTVIDCTVNFLFTAVTHGPEPTDTGEITSTNPWANFSLSTD